MRDIRWEYRRNMSSLKQRSEICVPLYYYVIPTAPIGGLVGRILGYRANISSRFALGYI